MRHRFRSIFRVSQRRLLPTAHSFEEGKHGVMPDGDVVLRTKPLCDFTPRPLAPAHRANLFEVLPQRGLKWLGSFHAPLP